MKAVLLAAGLGTRLRPVTGDAPKCMTPVGGRPVLERNVEWLVANGIRELAVNLHYRPEAVTRHFGDGAAFGARIHWSYERELLGTAGTVRSLAGWLAQERFLLVYADNVIGCDLQALLALHVQRSAAATVALFHRDDVAESGVAELAADARVVRFVEKPRPGETESHWVSAGLLAFEPAAVDHAPERGDVGRDLLPALLAAGERVVGYRMGADEPLHWIDTPADLERTAAAIGGAR